MRLCGSGERGGVSFQFVDSGLWRALPAFMVVKLLRLPHSAQPTANGNNSLQLQNPPLKSCSTLSGRAGFQKFIVQSERCHGRLYSAYAVVDTIHFFF